MKFKVFKKKEVGEKEVFFQVRELDEGGLELVTVHPDGSVQYYILTLDKEGITLMDGVGSEIGIAVLDGSGKVVILNE